MNDQERDLNPTTVVNGFGRLLEFKVDGQVYAQPLYVPHLAMPDGTTRNVLFVATMRNSVYAFIADAKTSDEARPLWELGPPETRVGPVASVGTLVKVSEHALVGLRANIFFRPGATSDPTPSPRYTGSFVLLWRP